MSLAVSGGNRSVFGIGTPAATGASDCCARPGCVYNASARPKAVEAKSRSKRTDFTNLNSRQASRPLFSGGILSDHILELRFSQRGRHQVMATVAILHGCKAPCVIGISYTLCVASIATAG